MLRPFKCSCNKYFPSEMNHCPHCGSHYSEINKMMIDGDYKGRFRIRAKDWKFAYGSAK